MKLSIRTRLSVSFSIIFTALIIIFSGTVYYLMSSDLEQELREDSAHDIEEVLLVFNQGTWQKQIEEMPEESREFNLLIKVLDPDGNTVYLTKGVNPWDWPTEPDLLKKASERAVWSDQDIGDVSHLVLTKRFIPKDKPPHFLQIANSRADNEAILSQLITCINIGTPVILFIAIFAGRFFSKKALAPVEQIRARAETIKSDNLHERLSYDGPADELSRLTSTLNDLLGRIQDSFNRLKVFTADASHELRIPLAGIRGTLEIGLRQKRSPEESREIMETAYRESERMSELVNELMTCARADAGAMELEKTEVELESFFKNLREEAEALNVDKNVQLHLGILPKGKATFDEVKVHQLLINLIENAIRYNKPNGNVSLRADLKEGRLIVDIQDDGIGISPADQEKIFDRFYRVDKARSREAGGTGLGLAIARSIAEAHKGTLTVQSLLGKGSLFRLSLPLS